VNQYDAFTVKRLGEHNAAVEATIAQEYAFLYGQTKAKLADLYASMGDTVTLEEARKYSRLQNLLASTRKAYEKLTKRTITKTGMLAAHNYTEEYFANMWTAETVEGPFKWKNPEVEAIRASVFWEETGLSFPKRFGKNAIVEITDIESAITRGIATGANYKKTAEMLKDSVTGGYNAALRIVRTESTRNRAEGFNAAYNVMANAGIDVRKVWITRMDGSEREDHAALNDAESDKNGMFHTAVGLVEGPGLSGVASFDINCRCALGTTFADEGPKKTQAELADEWDKWARDLGWTPEAGWPKAYQAV
jgi:Phage Mu protein F like protein